MIWYESLGRIELNIKLRDARSCSHQGDCELDVLVLMEKPSIRRQLDKLDPETVKTVLSEYGAWEDHEMQDHQPNLKRLLWLACCDIAEDNRFVKHTERIQP
jgi:hypothetical protein